jgi:uncharacterized protein
MASVVTTLNNRFLRLNVGFLLKESAGYSREFSFDQAEPITAEDVTITELHGSLRLTRTPQGILVQGVLHARTPVECTRCLTPFELAYDVEFSELFVYPKPAEASETSFVEDSGFIDLTPIMREEGILAVPMQALCKPDCKGLCSECGQNLNHGSCNCTHDRIDPRLASLRALLEE